MKRLTLVITLIVAVAPFVNAQSKSQVKPSTAPYSAPQSGREMYVAYCAACHGKNGKGDGPVASSLKKGPTDLTKLAAQNGGKFPELRVYDAINGDKALLPHGSKDMPIWGPVFSSLETQKGVVSLRLHNLTKYIESIQVK